MGGGNDVLNFYSQVFPITDEFNYSYKLYIMPSVLHKYYIRVFFQGFKRITFSAFKANKVLYEPQLLTNTFFYLEIIIR